MAHGFDPWGWYVGVVADGAARSTPLAPENTSTSMTPGALRANWTGHEWLALHYVEPEAPPEPQPVLPDEVETYRAHLVLIEVGAWQRVIDAIDAIEDVTLRTKVQVLFYRRPTIRRISQTTQLVQQLAQITDAERDAWFVQASVPL